MIEFFDYRRVNIDTSIVVDKSRGEKLTASLNITFPRVPCYRAFSNNLWLKQQWFNSSSVVSLDVMDISGETQRDISHNVVKTRLNAKGEMVANSAISQLGSDLDKISDVKQDNYCGSCYGGTEPEGGCCNTCESVRQAYINRGWSFTDPDAIDQVCTRK